MESQDLMVSGSCIPLVHAVLCTSGMKHESERTDLGLHGQRCAEEQHGCSNDDHTLHLRDADTHITSGNAMLCLLIGPMRLPCKPHMWSSDAKPELPSHLRFPVMQHCLSGTPTISLA